MGVVRPKSINDPLTLLFSAPTSTHLVPATARVLLAVLPIYNKSPRALRSALLNDNSCAEPPASLNVSNVFM